MKHRLITIVLTLISIGIASAQQSDIVIHLDSDGSSAISGIHAEPLLFIMAIRNRRRLNPAIGIKYSPKKSGRLNFAGFIYIDR